MTIAPAYNAWYKQATAKVKPETKRIYKIRRKLFVAYLAGRGQLRAELGAIQPEAYNDFLKDYSVNYRSTQLKYLRIFYNWCVKQKHIQRNPCLDQRLKWERKKYVALNGAEFKKLQAFTGLSRTLEKVRDMFIWQCFTGMAYCDMIRFNRSWVKDGWIEYTRRKSGTTAIVPMFPATVALIEKYAGNMHLMTRERYNLYIKDLSRIVGIDKILTSHAARKTCGRWLLNNGMSIEVVSRVLGHNDIKITQADYAHVDEERVLFEAAQVQARIKADGQKPPSPVHDVFKLDGFNGQAHGTGNGGVAASTGNVNAVQVFYDPHGKPVAIYYQGIFQPFPENNGINLHSGQGKGIGNLDGINPYQLRMFGNQPGQAALG